MRSRAISYYVMAYQGIIPVGSLLAGYMAQVAGPRATVFIEGAIGLTAIAGFVWYRNRDSNRNALLATAINK